MFNSNREAIAANKRLIVLLIFAVHYLAQCSTAIKSPKASPPSSSSSSSSSSVSSVWESLHNDVHSFVFLLPPTSFAYGQITLGLELYKRGHRVVFATLDGLQKHYNQQYHSIKLNNGEKRRKTLIEPEVISFGSTIKFEDSFLKLITSHGTLGFKNSTVEEKALAFYNSQFAKIIVGIEEQQSNIHDNITHSLYSNETFFIVPGPFQVPLQYFQNRHQPFAIVFPSPAVSMMLSSPIYSPDPSDTSLPSFKKSLTQRLKCLLRSFSLNIIYGHLITYPNPWLDVRPIFAQPILKLVTSIPSLSTLKSYPPLTIFTGPLVNKDRTAFELLDPQIQKILSGPLPVVYISLGTYAELNTTQMDFIVESTLPQDNKWAVIWSLKEKDQMSSDSVSRIQSVGNLFSIVPWLNSPSVLAHNNTVVFLSHCGANGLNEAVALGKAIVCLPLFGDQPANCNAAQENLQSVLCHFGFGSSKSREINQIINDVVSSPNNHAMIVNAKKAQIISADGYKGVETAANWLEAAAALKGDVRMLETPPEREGVVRSYCLDILAGVVIVIFNIGVCVGFRQRPKKPETWPSTVAKKVPYTKLLVWGCRVRESYLAVLDKLSFFKTKQE